ncbi:serine/threonine-protein kinase [Paenibacillus sp. FJAT-27812]|uniref:serine/threonine-protein kinase n=1 Tax=Paenibacillus sp. FJAT-27812 TaxID=1684143 RepID=UPI0006A797FC|nr:serine/threonine-protein kinase [Paenibacillus sp. FJAT-27812]
MESINGYNIIRNLGEGSFGTTYQVQKDGQDYALKLIRENILHKDVTDNRRIEREIRILRTVNNPYVVKYYDDGFISDGNQRYRYIVMEYIQGITLENYLINNKVSLATACSITKNIFQGINAIHNQSVIHRDLKPANIMVNDQLQIKLLDFGISKLVDASTLTTTGQAMGTFAYMPPEQLNAKDIDYRADFYSAAVILYELISGERPFTMSNQLEAIRKILGETPVPLASKISTVPIDISELVETLLKKQPFERAIHFEEIISRLEKHSNINAKNSTKITPVYFSNELQFLPMPINNDSKAVVAYNDSFKINGAVFNAPQLIFSDKNYMELSRENHNLKLIIDPFTQTLAYSAFTTKATYKKLPYLISDMKKETPKDFQSVKAIQERVIGTMEFQLNYNPRILLSPYHFLENDSSGWLNVDYNTYKEAKSYLIAKQISIPLYYGISLDIEQFEDIESITDLVNFVTSANPDGYYLQIAGSFDSTNRNHYYSYAYLVKLLSETKREIILSRINDFSLGLLSVGANTIASGLGQSDTFKKDFLNREESGSAARRYYIEKIMGLYNQNILQDILSTEIGSQCICNCMFCNNSINTDYLTEFYNTINHHITIKNNQFLQYTKLNKNERVGKFLDDVGTAVQLIKDINREKRIKNFTHSHLEVWKEVIIEINKIDMLKATQL